MSKTWLQTIAATQLPDLISGLKTDPFGGYHSINSIQTGVFFDGWYAFHFKLGFLSLEERASIFFDNDPNDSYGVMVDGCNEDISMGNITYEQADERKKEFLDDNAVPKFKAQVTLFTHSDDLSVLPFSGNDIAKLFKYLVDNTGVQFEVVNHVGLTGLVNTYHIKPQNYTAQEFI